MKKTIFILCVLASSALFAEEPTGIAFTLTPPDVFTEPVPEKYLPSQRAWQGIPALTVTPGGRLWMTWFSGGPCEPDANNYVQVVTSGDGGRTWSAPKLVVDHQTIVRAYDPQIWTDPQGRVWLFWCQTTEMWDGRGGVWAMTTENSEKADTTWSAPRRIADGIMCNHPCVDGEGRWIMPIAIWRAGGRKYDFGPQYAPNMFVSEDNGQTFRWLGAPAAPDETSIWDEHAIVERQDGTFWMLVRTTYGLGESFSADKGKTWTPLTPSKIPHTSSRFAFAKLTSGKILLLKNGPMNQDIGRTQINAFLSEDDGQTWRGPLLLDDRKNVSYPQISQTLDGTIYATWDFDRGGAQEIWFAHFTEADIQNNATLPATQKVRVSGK